VIDPLIMTRGAHFAATLIASGTIAFMLLVTEPATRASAPADFGVFRRRLIALIWFALAVMILSGAVWLALLASDILGTSFADICLHGGAWPVLTDTRFGLVWCIRLALVLLIGLFVLWPAARALQLVAAAMLAALPALVGHAGAAPGITGIVHLASDAVHLLAAGAWLGALPAFALLLSHAKRTAEPSWYDFTIRTTHRFSIVGILSVGALLASGVVNTWFLLGSPRDLLTTDYGRLVAFKIGLFAAMVSIATVNRFYLSPRLPQPSALRVLRRNSLIEIGLGLCVLFFAGMLGTLQPTAHVHPAPSSIPPDAAFVHIHGRDAMADVTIDPGRAGRANVTIRVSREDFSPFPAKDVRLAIEPPTGTADAPERAAIKQGDGSWRVDGIEVTAPGIWTVRVIITPGADVPIVLDAPVVIAR
jgi:putative copper resistance protein D